MMQIRSILLYDLTGLIKRLDFRLDALNIITGESYTGKSSIHKIISYYMGSDTFRVSGPEFEQRVSHYAVLYQLGGLQVFVAKSKPEYPKKSNSAVRYEIASQVSVPQTSAELLAIPVSNDDALIDMLSVRLGIRSNLTVTQANKKSAPIQLNLRHTEYFLVQDQGTIANEAVLFNRQVEGVHPIREALDYFLNVTPESSYSIQKEIDLARRELRRVIDEREHIKQAFESVFERGTMLILEAQEVGLIDRNIRAASSEEIFAILRPLRTWIPTQTLDEPGNVARPLEESVATLRREINELDEKLDVAARYQTTVSGFQFEATEQERRLESIGLFSEPEQATSCPVCGSELEIVNEQVQLINQSLKKVKAELQFVTRDIPDLDREITRLRDERQSIIRELTRHKAQLQAVYDSQQARSQIANRVTQASIVVGRITYFLDVTPSQNQELTDITLKIQGMEGRLKELETQIDNETISERRTSIMHIVSTYMTSYAENIPLNQKGPFRLDYGKLTVVADDPIIPRIMGRNMPSGSNYLACHLITFLALHRFFRENTRPVPAFIIFDQLTQTRYPRGEEAGTHVVADRDRQEVETIFRTLNDFANEQKVQVIVLDHADIDEPYFREAKVAEWINGQGLVPSASTALPASTS